MTVDELRDKRLTLEREIEVSISRFVEETGVIPSLVDVSVSKVSLFSGECHYTGSRIHVSAEV